jgi:hypothetical protein
VSAIERIGGLQPVDPLQVDAEHLEQFCEPHAINDAKREQLVDARCGVRVLELRQPGRGYYILAVALFFSDPATGLIHIAHAQTQTVAHFLQPVRS